VLKPLPQRQYNQVSLQPFFIDDLLNPNRKEEESYGRFGFAVGGRSKDCMLEQTYLQFSLNNLLFV
jgi:hypothetical protein